MPDKADTVGSLTWPFSCSFACCMQMDADGCRYTQPASASGQSSPMVKASKSSWTTSHWSFGFPSLTGRCGSVCAPVFRANHVFPENRKQIYPIEPNVIFEPAMTVTTARPWPRGKPGEKDREKGRLYATSCHFCSHTAHDVKQPNCLV